MTATPETQSRHKIEPKLIVPFVNSVRLVMSTMTGLTTKFGPTKIRTTPGSEFDYSGIIGSSGAVVGTVVVSFGKESAETVVAAFAKTPIEAGSADFADALGELTNTIAGAAKKEIAVNASISVPTVVMGPGHVITRPSDVPCVSVSCDAGGAMFAVELSIRSA